MRDMGLHAQEHGWARGVTWIAGRRRWSRYGESPGRRDGVWATVLGRPWRDLRAVAVPGEFCVIKDRLRANLKLCRVIPQQINKLVPQVVTALHP